MVFVSYNLSNISCLKVVVDIVGDIGRVVDMQGDKIVGIGKYEWTLFF